MGCEQHDHTFGKVAYVAYVDGDRNVHRVELRKCACGITEWAETHVDLAVKSVTDADLKGTEEPAKP